jgi:hypothetical protein
LPDNNARLARAYSMLGLRERPRPYCRRETEPLLRQITPGSARGGRHRSRPCRGSGWSARSAGVRLRCSRGSVAGAT